MIKLLIKCHNRVDGYSPFWTEKTICGRNREELLFFYNQEGIKYNQFKGVFSPEMREKDPMLSCIPPTECEAIYCWYNNNTGLRFEAIQFVPYEYTEEVKQ